MTTQGALLAAGEREVALEPRNADVTVMFERFATDPNVSVEKIERLMALLERNEAKRAEMAFNSAMTRAQKAMRSIVADSYNNQTRSRYASYEALDRAIRPIYTEHGFGVTFNTGEAPKDETVRVQAKVTHEGGHAEHYHVDMPADGKGAKGGDVMTKTHATGSALSYGQRYLSRLIWNLSVTDDDDGNAAASAKPPAAVPAGFDDWWVDMASASDNGTKVLGEAWAKSKQEFKAYVIKERSKEWNAMKAKAARVAAS